MTGSNTAWPITKIFLFNSLQVFQFGLLRAFNQLESLFIRPWAPEDGQYRGRLNTVQRYPE